MRRGLRVGGLWVLGACGGPLSKPTPLPATGADSGPVEGATGEGSGTSVSTDSDPPDSGLPTGPTYLSWEGVDTLTVDVFMDGSVECVFRWRTSGIRAVDPCTDCTFDFEVQVVPTSEGSTCSGAISRTERRWLRAGVLYHGDQPFDEYTDDDGVLQARWSTMAIDETYGAAVASTLEVEALLR